MALRVAEARAANGIQRDDRFPSIAAGIDGSRAWTFLPSLSLPIFGAGRHRVALDLAEVRRDLAVANYEKSVQSPF